VATASTASQRTRDVRAPDVDIVVDRDRAEKALLIAIAATVHPRRGLVLEAGKTLDLGTITTDAPTSGSGAP
jgi:hypothetical protein